MELPIYPLFVAGGIAFWATAMVGMFFMMCCIANDAWGEAGMIFAVWCGLVLALASGAQAEWLTTRNVLYAAVGYVPIGLAYMTFRWWLFVTKNRYAFRDILIDYAGEHGFDLADGKIPMEHRAEFTKWWKNSPETTWRENTGINPKPWDSRHKLTTWAAWWPVSGLMWLLGDFVRGFWLWMIRKMSGVLSAISERIWPDVSDNFEDENGPV